MTTTPSAFTRMVGATVRAKVEAATGSVRRDDLVASVYTAHPNEVAQLRDLLAEKYVGELVDKVLKADIESDQQTLPGLDIGPVVKIGEGEYISSYKVTWCGLEASEKFMIDNAERVQARLVRRQDMMRTYRPYMQPHPTRTLAEADALRRGINP